jgi:hypothetical protein
MIPPNKTDYFPVRLLNLFFLFSTRNKTISFQQYVLTSINSSRVVAKSAFKCLNVPMGEILIVIYTLPTASGFT